MPRIFCTLPDALGQVRSVHLFVVKKRALIFWGGALHQWQCCVDAPFRHVNFQHRDCVGSALGWQVFRRTTSRTISGTPMSTRTMSS